MKDRFDEILDFGRKLGERGEILADVGCEDVRAATLGVFDPANDFWRDKLMER